MGRLRAANPGETFEDDVAHTALKRLGQPEDIARVVARTPAGSTVRTSPPTAATCPERAAVSRPAAASPGRRT